MVATRWRGRRTATRWQFGFGDGMRWLGLLREIVTFSYRRGTDIARTGKEGSGAHGTEEGD